MTLADIWTWLTTTNLLIVAAWFVGVPVGFLVLCFFGLMIGDSVPARPAKPLGRYEGSNAWAPTYLKIPCRDDNCTYYHG